jgi:multimeric flavodoxin WrbA
MNILVIHGSMRKGNTYALTKEIVNRLTKRPDVECVEINVADLDLPFCASCHVCFDKGEEYCPHYNIMQKIESAVQKCDGVIIGGSTYLRALNAAMKNVLDHMAYGYHRPWLFGRKGMVVATSAGVGENSVAKFVKTVLGQWGINGALIVKQNAKAQLMQASAKTSASLDRKAEKFYRLIASKKQVAPGLMNITVHNAFRAMSLSNYSASERDTQFWRRAGFSDRAYPVKAGPFMYAMGTIIHGVIKIAINITGRSYEKRQTV